MVSASLRPYAFVENDYLWAIIKAACTYRAG